MKKSDVIKTLLNHRYVYTENTSGSAFAPANIALCKYWGKRDIELNLPVTSSLSVSLGEKGAHTTVSLINASEDKIRINEEDITLDTQIAKRLIEFLDLFRSNTEMHFAIDTKINIPMSAGLASSACSFAALIQALDQLFSWQLDRINLSILARLGSGSACRSLWDGFVKWHAGKEEDGMDSFAELLPYEWPHLCVGLLVISDQPKPISSREAMQKTVNTSCYYKSWPEKVKTDLEVLQEAIASRDFDLFGSVAESNALAMHASMLTANPPILYWLPETVAMMHQIWKKRAEGLPIYFTQDAGPNLKLLFLKTDIEQVKKTFPEIKIIMPFEKH